MEIFVYSLKNCGHCDLLKNKLDEEELEYTVYEVSEKREMYEEVMKITNKDALPTLLIRNPENNKGQFLVAGTDFITPDEAIVLINHF